MQNLNSEQRKAIARMARIELARRDFFYYCNLKAADFYKEDREFLKELCFELQDFYESDNDEVLIVNLPPRHGKSRTAGLLVEWILGKDKNQKIMTGSYNETLSTMFSKNVRNSIQEQKADEAKVVYSDVFPGVKIKHGDGAMNLWSLDGGYNNYLATSPGGTATGFGCSILMIDDLIKNAEEANNEAVLERHWEWFTNTMLSRLEEGGKIIIIMTRWATGDLAGRALNHFKEEGKRCREIKMKALKDNGEMLCDEILSYRSYKMKANAMGENIASANYQQEPIDLKGVLYKNLKTYEKLPPYFEHIINYTDTADEGTDYLCSICAGVFEGEAYILDVIYTRDGMEITEPLTAEFFIKNTVNAALIESNNGGKGFARNVIRIMWEVFKSKATSVKWFHQSKNKKARILTNSTFIMNHVYFPIMWKNKWPEFYKAITKYQKEGKNINDDGPDALTGIAEICQNGYKLKGDNEEVKEEQNIEKRRARRNVY